MSKDPERCCVVKAGGERCTGKPMYKIGRKGFCEQHKPTQKRTRELTGTGTAATDQRNYCGF